MHLRLPDPLRIWSLRWFANRYKINLQECELPLESYPSIGEFFVRRLKEGLRPLAKAEVLHPADSAITQIDTIHADQMIQAKGRSYSIAEIVQNPAASKDFENGIFVTYYLCPTDYHRVHSPVSGQIISVTHIPGQLWPVHQRSVQAIDKLFSLNERIVVEIKTPRGNVAVIFIGALNVGKIVLSFDPEIVGNDLQSQLIRKQQYQRPIAIEKGDELGLFRMGSTVVVFYPANYQTVIPLQKWQAQIGAKVQVNSALSDG